MSWEIVYQDYLVASARFVWARKRNTKKRPGRKGKANTRNPDYRIHGDTLRDVLLLLHDLGGKDAPGHDEERKRARAITKARLDVDRSVGCLCGHSGCERWIPEATHA